MVGYVNIVLVDTRPVSAKRFSLYKIDHSYCDTMQSLKLFKAAMQCYVGVSTQIQLWITAQGRAC